MRSTVRISAAVVPCVTPKRSTPEISKYTIVSSNKTTETTRLSLFSANICASPLSFAQGEATTLRPPIARATGNATRTRGNSRKYSKICEKQAHSASKNAKIGPGFNHSRKTACGRSQSSPSRPHSFGPRSGEKAHASASDFGRKPEPGTGVRSYIRL